MCSSVLSESRQHHAKNFRASWKKITNPSHDPFSSTDPSAFPFSIHFSSSRHSILLTLDRERGKEDSNESRRCCCLFSPWNTFCRWRKRRRGEGRGKKKKKERREKSLLSARQQRWGNKEYREMRFAFEIINFDLCSVSGFTNELDL